MTALYLVSVDSPDSIPFLLSAHHLFDDQSLRGAVAATVTSAQVATTLQATTLPTKRVETEAYYIVQNGHSHSFYPDITLFFVIA